MKFKVSQPVTIADRAPYSTLDMVRHVTSTDPRYNTSASAARAGLRTIAAFEAGSEVELTDDDLRLLAQVVEKPAGGWGAFTVDREVPQKQPDGSIGTATFKQRVNVPAVEFLPLIDPIAEAASRLPQASK